VAEANITSGIASGKDIFKAEQILSDRVINLQFIRKSKKTFTIRTDYEPVYHKDNTVTFKKCAYKPSIKLSYEQYSNSTITKVTIDVAGLYVQQDAGSSRFWASDEDPIEWCVVQAGYIDQFPDWTSKEYRNNIDQFFDLNNNGITSDAEVLRGTQILVQILSNYQIAVPPERVWRFEGVIGTVDTGLYWYHTEADLLRADYNNKDFPTDLSPVEAIMFEMITRRFVRSGVKHSTTVKEVKTKSGDIKYNQEVLIYGYDQYTNPTVEDTEYTSIILDNGVLGINDAKLFGVQCFCSDALRKTEWKALYTSLYSGLQEQFAEIAPEVFNNVQTNMVAQVKALQQYFPYLRWYLLNNGNIYFYHVDEPAPFSDPLIKQWQGEGKTLTLPAVYEMTMDALRTIRVPFFSFIDPLTTVRFRSFYISSTSTGFFTYPDESDDTYLVLFSSVSFSTTGKENMTKLTCVSVPNEEAPSMDATGKITPASYTKYSTDYSGKTKEREERRNNFWVQRTFNVDKKGASSGWLGLAFYLINNAQGWSSQPSVQQALLDLKSWNESLWGSNLSTTEVSPENDAAKKLGLTVAIPWLYVGDSIVIKYPYRPLYDDNFKE